MRQDPPTMQDALSLASRVDPKFKPVWEERNQDTQAALSRYFLPWSSTKQFLAPTRPKVIKWYCPFASQKSFPSGHRYCINVFTGCSHRCTYCYANGYGPDRPGVKRNFHRLVDRDMRDLVAFDVPAAPVHVSNSTDPFQPLEIHTWHTRYVLEKIEAHRSRFTTVTILTKNPLLAASAEYLELLRSLSQVSLEHSSVKPQKHSPTPPVQVEVSLAFWRDEARAFYDPGAPSVEERKEGVQALSEAGIPVVLRIDPLFVRFPIPGMPQVRVSDVGLPPAQQPDDIESLVEFAKQMRVRHVVYSPLKIVRPRSAGMSPAMSAMRAVYSAITSPEQPVWRGGSWRLPKHISDRLIVAPFLATCNEQGVTAKFCKQNLLDTR